jgi:murein DD-endopeptidase MepM/ murein hydrolase activator NlpD
MMSNPEPWIWPLQSWRMPLIPDGNHRGAFGKVRRHDIHTGVDLYCDPGTKVFAVEGGKVVAIENFTGPNADDPSPWWNDTKAILIKGESGVILYGEVTLVDTHGLGDSLREGDVVEAGSHIGYAAQVLKKDKGLPMCMLHFELYKPGTDESVWWKPENPQPENLLDPTEKLKIAFYNLDSDGFKSMHGKSYQQGYDKGYREGERQGFNNGYYNDKPFGSAGGC